MPAPKPPFTSDRISRTGAPFAQSSSASACASAMSEPSPLALSTMINSARRPRIASSAVRAARRVIGAVR
ncbi:hypothetical protein [Citreimonas sp.]|uniref:hypothetical protein n=1 Tax=Citreimonas sp. TaxID=3036715 RepID=UPI0035C87684